MSTLVIVESPAKSKTLANYLGPSYQVLASYGHVRDLLPKEGAVETNNQFKPHYHVLERSKKYVDAIIKAAKKADTILLAPDPDREGEAIAHHIWVLLEEANVLKGKTVARVVFHEITKKAILAAVQSPRALSQALVDAQQTRRILDYLVGFYLSPLLWKKVRPGLSAGRVQTPALIVIVKREKEIQAFEAQEYWHLEAACLKNKKTFISKLTHLNGDKLEQFSIVNEAKATEAKAQLEKDLAGELVVDSIKHKNRQRHPAAPFTTSTLQQEAARKLGFSAQKTMRQAQQLYEGIDVGSGTAGLITYMRTDSVHLAQEAIEQIRDLIVERYSQEDLPDSPRLYKTKSKNAQEAHEAIRPTDMSRTPESIKSHLTADQYKLYRLIYLRTLASQMKSAIMALVTIDLMKAEHRFRATGSTIQYPGFIQVYEEGLDDSKKEEDVLLPDLKEGDTVKVKGLSAIQHFTEPPPRYTEASLVKTLEEYGIGRPSTYASIISTLQQREYVILEKKRFIPTDVGNIVAQFLEQYFNDVVNKDFTATLEDTLDAIAREEKQSIPVLDSFWTPFESQVKTIDASVKRQDVTHEALDEKCPECGEGLSIRLGKRGRFVGCSAYPECKFTRSMDGEVNASEPEVVKDETCPKCHSELHIKSGRYGKFIGCSQYPTCKHMAPLEKPEDTGVQCPECKKDTLLKRKSRYGKIFYSCQSYPKCQYAVWYPPVAEPCPKCDWPITTIKTTKRRGTERVCPQKGCDFSESLPDDAEK